MQTKAGRIKARATIEKRHGKDFWKKIGAVGGRNGHEKGFFLDRELAARAGRIGGKKSKRGKKNASK
jgi:uncharacterized protein